MRQFLILLVVCFPLNAKEKTYDDYVQDTNNAEEKIDFSGSLLRHDGLDQVIKDRLKKNEKERKSKYTQYNRKKSSTDSSMDNSSSTKNKDKLKNTNEKTKSITAIGKTNTDINKKPGLEISVVEEDKIVKTNEPNKKKNVSSNNKNKTGKQNGSWKSNKNNYSTIHNGKKIYIPPSLRGANNKTTNINIQSIPNNINIQFGITKGSRIKVSLNNSATNIQPGHIKFHTLEDVMGYKDVLPKGTLLFARPGSAVLGSDRLHGNVTDGLIKSDHREFKFSGIILDEEGNPGLIAHVISDGKAFDRAKNVGAKTIGNSILNMVPAGGVGADTGKAAAGQLLNESTSEESVKDGRPVYIIKADSQHAIIEIEETF